MKKGMIATLMVVSLLGLAAPAAAAPPAPTPAERCWKDIATWGDGSWWGCGSSGGAGSKCVCYFWTALKGGYGFDAVATDPDDMEECAQCKAVGPCCALISQHHLIFRVHLVGRWTYPVAVEGVVLSTDPNLQLAPRVASKIAVVTVGSKRWVRFDFALPPGDYKIYARAGKPSTQHFKPIWVAWPVPVRLDRDRDVTLTLDP